MKNFHTLTAVIEVATGLGMIAVPGLVAALLLSAEITTSLELVMARLSGVALLALGVACWLARNDARSPAARGLAGGVLFYDAGAVVVLLYALIGVGLTGVLFWPAVLLHGAMTVWGVVLLLQKPAPSMGYAK